MKSVYQTDAYREFVWAYLAARDATRERPSPGALPRNPAAARVFVDAYSDDGPRGVASCGGDALRCDAAAGAFDVGPHDHLSELLGPGFVLEMGGCDD